MRARNGAEAREVNAEENKISVLRSDFPIVKSNLSYCEAAEPRALSCCLEKARIEVSG